VKLKTGPTLDEIRQHFERIRRVEGQAMVRYAEAMRRISRVDVVAVPSLQETYKRLKAIRDREPIR
jgi:hypothetical protein